MLIWVKLIGLMMVALGAAFFVSPERAKQFTDFCRQGKRMYGVGVLRIAFGLIFLAAAYQSRWPVFIGVMGAVTLVAGILILVMGPAKFEPMLTWFNERSYAFMRFLALITVGLGVLVVCGAA